MRGQRKRRGWGGKSEGWRGQGREGERETQGGRERGNGGRERERDQEQWRLVHARDKLKTSLRASRQSA